MGSMFDAHNHLRCQNYTIIGGRLVDFLWPSSSHRWRFVLLVMDEFIRFDVMKLQIKGNIKLQLGTSPVYICMDFVTMLLGSLGKHKKWVPCKHMYYVLQHVMFCDRFENFIHFSTWNRDEVCCLLVHSLAFM
jgi:hypothetical protein